MMRIEEDRLKKEQALQLAKEQGTPADITARHKVVRSAENVIPALKDLRDMKLPSVGFGTTVGSPKTLASYNTRIVNLVESMLGAYGLSATDKSIKAVEESIKKHSFEGDKAYRQRLDHIIKDIQERKSRAKEGNPLEGDENDRMRAFIDTALSGGGSSNIAKQSDDDLLKIVRGS